jgi:spore coat protein U-like protein
MITPVRTGRAPLFLPLVALCAAPALVRADQCFVSSPGLAFGVYDMGSATNLPGAGTMTITCNQDRSTVRLSLTAGSGSGGNPVMRNAAGDTLAYGLYTDAARTVPWTPSTVLTFTPGKQVPYSVQVYGAIFARQDASVGSYSDSLSITVNF